MIEYYTFKHRGDALDYQDEVFLRLVPSLTVAIFFGSNLAIAPKSQALLFSEILNSEEGGRSIDFLSADFDECLDEESEYLILRVLDNGVECYRRGGVYAKIIKDGQIKVLPNGFFGMSNSCQRSCHHTCTITRLTASIPTFPLRNSCTPFSSCWNSAWLWSF